MSLGYMLVAEFRLGFLQSDQLQDPWTLIINRRITKFLIRLPGSVRPEDTVSLET